MINTIAYELNTAITPEELSRLFKASGIKRPAK